MPINIEISDGDITYLNQQAKEELKKALHNHCKDLLEEANRLESNIRTTRGDPEITSSHIRDASIVVNRLFINRPKPVWLYLIKFGAIISALFTGLVYDQIGTLAGQLWFSGLLVLTTILTSIQVIKE